MKYVIIGNAIAGVAGIEGIRAVDSNGEITVISGENRPAYGRPLISYLLEGKTTEQKLNYRDSDFYEKNGVVTVNGIAQAIDPVKKVVSGDFGSLPYDKLLVATGSRAAVPPIEGLAEVKNQFTFMTVKDALALQKALGKRKDKRVLIMGAGLIGLKCAEGIAHLAKSVTVADIAERVLPNVLNVESAQMLQAVLEKNGIDIILSDGVKRFSLDTAELSSGKVVPFDILVVAVGVRPNTELVKAAGGEVARGIVTDDRQKTTLPDVYAAGDCVESYDVTANERRILALLPNAYLQGEVAGRAMAGGNAQFSKAIPMNAAGFFGVHLVTAGVYAGDCYRVKTKDGFKELFYKDNRLKGFILFGNIDRAGIYTSLLREQTPLDSIDFDLICESPQLLAFEKSERGRRLNFVGKE